jgi:alkylation response protein AidB-like acyl-CoA dehydrogenase
MKTMTAAAEIVTLPQAPVDPLAIARELGPRFASCAAAVDDADAFVAENYVALKASGLVEAGVPVELGGGGAEVRALCAMLTELAHHCSSTALAFAMHTHQVAIPAWRLKHQNAAPVAAILKRVAAERLILLTSGGSDWIMGSGKAERVEGGYKITARKIFTSASPVGDVLMTGAVLEDGEAGPTVLHFGLPMSSPAVKIMPTWKALGMRGTGSNDVMIDGHFLPEAGVAARRPQGEWHMLFLVTTMLAFPLIYAAYLGVAESARDLAIEIARGRKPGAPAPSPHVVELIGRMDTELAGARFAHEAMIAAAERGSPSHETTNTIMMGRSLVASHALATVDLAMEVAGGSAFYRDRGLERRFRDIQGVRYHPMQPGAQQTFAGKMALGLDVKTTY